MPLNGMAQNQTPSTRLGTDALQNNPTLPEGERDKPVDFSPTPAAPPQMPKILEDIRVSVQAYQVTGFDQVGADKWAEVLSEFTGDNRSFEDMANAAATVTRTLQGEWGLYLAYAYIPAQDLKNGTVEIRVLPGILDKVEVIWPDQELAVDRDIIQAHLSALRPGTLIQVREVERVVFLLNDLRGVGVRFGIQPGLETGTATLVAEPFNTDTAVAEVTLDDQGSRFAGELRATATVSIHSPAGRGDSLTLTHLRSDTGGLEFSLLGYSTPIGSDGLKVGVNLSKVNYSFEENSLPLGLEGDSTTVSAFGLYPFYRSRNFNLFATFGMDRRYYSDRLRLIGSETRKDIQATQLGLVSDARDAWGGGGLSSAHLRLIRSSVDYAAGRPGGLDDAAHAMKWEWEYSRLQTLVPG
ncbi:MAG: POTRA domain-containing protein, partial [Limnobacter sp.]|nr:POTRA domain-containing protein [Limnobacter sp.]